MKVVLNNCWGGFSLSDEAKDMFVSLGGAPKQVDRFSVDRTDPTVVEVVEKLGLRANGECADLKIVDIPEDIEYYIDDYDGVETIHEAHRSW